MHCYILYFYVTTDINQYSSLTNTRKERTTGEMKLSGQKQNLSGSLKYMELVSLCDPINISLLVKMCILLVARIIIVYSTLSEDLCKIPPLFLDPRGKYAFSRPWQVLTLCWFTTVICNCPLMFNGGRYTRSESVLKTVGYSEVARHVTECICNQKSCKAC